MIKLLTIVNDTVISDLPPDQVELLLMGDYLDSAPYREDPARKLGVWFCPALVPDNARAVLLPRASWCASDWRDVVVAESALFNNAAKLAALLPAVR